MRAQFLVPGLLVLIATALAAAADAPAYDPERFLADKSPALVTVKFLLRTDGGSDSEDSEAEVTGVMIDPKGLVLCSNMQLTGLSGLMPGFGRMSAVPRDIRVLLGEDTEGLKARLLARDRELDLAWIQIQDPPDRPLACVDLRKAARPRLGQRVVSVRRLGKYFDRVPAIRESQISAVVRKPRELYVLGGALNVDFGLPVFAITGEVIGITILPIAEDDELGDNPMSMLGGLSGLLDLVGGVVLPADEVLKATRRAREHPRSQPADEASPASKPADPDDQ